MTEHPVTRGALCPKGNSVLEIIYHRDRLHYPLRKVNGGWQRVTWDEALSVVASKVETFKDTYGPNSISFLSSARCSNEENYVLQKLARLIGTNNIDHCARI
jgi:formate dehydrogenase major subunit